MSRDEKIVPISGTTVSRYGNDKIMWEVTHRTETIEKLLSEINIDIYEIISATIHRTVHHVKPALQNAISQCTKLIGR